MQRVVPTSCPDCKLSLRRGDSITNSISGITASSEQINANLAAYSVLRGNSAESVVVCLLNLVGKEVLRRRKSGA